MSDQGVRQSSSISGQLVSSEGHNSFVRTLIWVFLDSMERPLSPEYTHILEEDNRCQTKVIDRALLGQVSSSIQVSSSELTTYDLKLWNVITPSSELQFGFSWTLWKDH